MPRSCSEVLLGTLLLLVLLGSVQSRSHLSSLQELELSSLRTHKQLLQAEISRLYLEQPARPETQLLLDDLHLRDHQLTGQIESLEGVAKGDSGTQRLAINLTADFEHLQHKLDDLKHQLELLDGRFASQGKQLEAGSSASEITPPAPSAGLGSFLWGPLLTMPEFPQGSVASDHSSHHQQDHHQDQQQQQGSSPSIIKRVLDMLRPSVGVANLRNRWAETEKSATGSGLGKSSHPLSAEELLPQLQEQRRFLDDAITRLELLAVKKSSKKT